MSVLVLFVKAFAVAAGIAGGICLAPVIAFALLVAFFGVLYFFAWIADNSYKWFR